MQKTAPTPSKGGIGLQDILFVLFKHKWKIILLGILGLAAAAGVFFTQKPLFESHAKILVRHVVQRGGIDGTDSQVDASGRSGEQVVNTEIVIIRSGDLANKVAKSVGVERLAPGSSDKMALIDAAQAVQAGLEVAPENRGSNVLVVTYRHTDPELAREVLAEVVRLYPEEHLEVHRSVGAFDSVAKQTNIVREKLQQTERELEELKSKHKITTVEAKLLSLTLLKDKTEGEIVTAEAELAAQLAKVKDLEKNLGVPPPNAKNGANKPVPAAPTPEQLVEYRDITTRLDRLQEQDVELSKTLRENDPQRRRIKSESDLLKASRGDLLKIAPGLAIQAAPANGEIPVNPNLQLQNEKALLGSIEARIARYRLHLEELDVEFKKLAEISPRFKELQLERETQEGEYRLLESNLKKATLDQALDRTQIPGLKVMEQPTPAAKGFNEKTKKLMFGLAACGFALGIALAFLLELVVDRRITRPAEIETRLQVPLMLSIPYVRPKNRGAHLIANDGSEANGGEGQKMLPAVRTPNGIPGFPGRTDHFIHPYSEAIRDRIVFNFQINNMTHKPKLMAVTGLSAGAGTSTIAAGLAKAFSEVNGAKVLLVDLNSDYPDDNPMFGNRPLHSVVGALQAARNTRFKEGGQNLYLASAAATKADANATPFGPMHLYELLPHFRASEFDYVIFDMPPMAPTSPTLAMAGLLDKVLLVVDGEDTSRDALKWGYSELVKGRADVSCVFNKARTHAPRWVAGDM
ncbi:Wzz/FepE/Etk N-terminal domain-containing protein [Luteolibacter flavescens]|uniref:Wzz/FepE/Etk N-terminal domain-containing protein n=1 Tax=Luteolibacter flavescens TaxID=1859460 RepID=A0ABT3FS14_9BACT|nr:Wzz/FepE/Etk N-terminal domain-containing protein [Luteolibacter flavescens]MCW1886368.1 Wzz/FepE/Etk N-terminal domain-containing protein [Luteolibacter flavescens]